MNEQPYKTEHLQDYQGILTSDDARSERFKMELKAEDNPVLERSIEKIESSIELEFYYNMGHAMLFFHDIFSCPSYREKKECHECEKMREIDRKFSSNIKNLQVGDTFKIRAVLINNARSVLPREINNFKSYEPLIVACDEYSLRLPDTPEGINKKYALEQQRLQREQEEEEKSKENEEQARKDAETRIRNERIQQFFGKRPNLNQIIVTVIGTTIANQIPNIVKFVKYISRLFVSN